MMVNAAYGYMLLLGYLGLRRRVGFASWHMFAGLSMCEFHLVHNGECAPFNPWLYLPHSHISMSRGELEIFLQYLRDVRGLKLSGSVILYEKLKTISLRVESSYVAR